MSSAPAASLHCAVRCRRRCAALATTRCSVALPQRREALLAGAASLALLSSSPSLVARAADTPGAGVLPQVPRGAALGAARVTPSAVIKGCWQLSGSHRGDEASDRTSADKAKADFPKFVAAGIDTFDVGPAECGYGAAESKVGEYLKAAKDESSLVFTKLCCVGGEQSRPTKEWVASRVSAPLAKLGRSRIDLMQLYWNDYGYTNELISTALYLMDEKAAGRVRAVGFTNMNTPILAKLADAGVEVASHQIQFSLLDRRPRKEQLAWCASSGCKLLPYGVLAGGLLSDKYVGKAASDVVVDTASKAKYSSVLRRAGGWEWLQRLLAVLRSIGDEKSAAGRPPVSVANVASRWALQQPAVGALILGARNAEHVDDHRALFGFELGDADLGRIEEVLSQGVQPQGDTYDWERGSGPF